MKRVLQIDVAHDCTIGDLLLFMESYNGRITGTVAVGPSGNPVITFEFGSEVDRLLFKQAYDAGMCNPVQITYGNINEEDLPYPDEARGLEPSREPVRSYKDQPE